MGAVLAHEPAISPIAGGVAVIHHGITFGGHPMSAAIGLKNIEIFERDGVLRALPAPRHGAAGAAAVQPGRVARRRSAPAPTAWVD